MIRNEMINFQEKGVIVYDCKKKQFIQVYGVLLGCLSDSKATEKKARKVQNGRNVNWICPYCTIKKEHVSDMKCNNTQFQQRDIKHCWYNLKKDVAKYHEESINSGYLVPNFKVCIFVKLFF